MTYLALFLSWYIGAFLTSMVHGINRYRRVSRSRWRCLLAVLCVSVVWPFFVPFLLIVFPSFAFFAALLTVYRNGYNYLTHLMDSVVRGALK